MANTGALVSTLPPAKRPSASPAHITEMMTIGDKAMIDEIGGHRYEVMVEVDKHRYRTPTFGSRDNIGLHARDDQRVRAECRRSLLTLRQKAKGHVICI